MNNKFKDIDIKNRTYWFFNDIINIEDFDLNNRKMDENSCEGIYFYYAGYGGNKEYIKKYSLNPLYLFFRKVNEYFEKINKSNYLTLIPTNESKIIIIMIIIIIMKNCGVKSEI